jgi:hypothetical protein
MCLVVPAPSLPFREPRLAGLLPGLLPLRGIAPGYCMAAPLALEDSRAQRKAIHFVPIPSIPVLAFLHLRSSRSSAVGNSQRSDAGRNGIHHRRCIPSGIQFLGIRWMVPPPGDPCSVVAGGDGEGDGWRADAEATAATGGVAGGVAWTDAVVDAGADSDAATGVVGSVAAGGDGASARGGASSGVR